MFYSKVFVANEYRKKPTSNIEEQLREANKQVTPTRIHEVEKEQG